MGSIILGVFLGALIASLVGFVGWVIYDFCFSEWAETLTRVVTVVLMVGCLVGGGVSGGSMEYHGNRQWYDSYIAQKQTIELSLTKTELTGFEKIALVQQASELNGELAKRAYTAQQWYGFLSDPRVVDAESVNLDP